MDNPCRRLDVVNRFGTGGHRMPCKHTNIFVGRLRFVLDYPGSKSGLLSRMVTD
jgi:hypothetical protein